MRNLNRVITLIVINIFLLSSFVFAQEIKPSENLVTGKLPNGIKYYFVKNSFPKNKGNINLVVDTGSLNETEIERGGTHFLEHMAFNGTKKYPKNNLVKYLESIGLKFGNDLNAYTSFDETAFKLEIPSNEKDLEIALDILHQWAYEIVITPEEVNKEKGVISEEWRGRQGLRDRVFRAKGEKLFQGSPIMERMPIGTLESINSFDEKKLKGYYEKWYTPEKMSIIVVGDFSEAQVKKAIEDKFSKGVDTHKNSNLPSNKIVIPETKESFVVFKDKELTTARATLSYIERLDEINNFDNLKTGLIEALFFEIFNTRVSQLTKEKNPAIISGVGYSYPLVQGNKVVEINFALKDEEVLRGYEEIYTLLKTMSTYAPNISELDVEKNEIISQLKSLNNNKESQKNEEIVEEIQNYHRDGEVYLNPKDKLENYDKVLKEITPEDILKYGEKFYKKEKLRFIMLSQDEKFKNITEDSLKTIESKVNGSKVLPWNSVEVKTLDIKKGIDGKILERKVENQGTPYETLNYKLSNGIEVIYKKTDFEKDKIYLTFYKKEGDSTENKVGYLNSIFTPYIIDSSGVGNLDSKEREIFMKGKNFAISSDVSTYTQGFSIISDNENLNYALESLTGLILEKKLDETIFNSTMKTQRENLRNRENSPLFHFYRAMKKAVYGEDWRKTPLEERDLELVTKEGVLDIYNRKFSNFNGYTLVVVGSISKEKLEESLIKYFSTYPAKKSLETYKKVEVKIPNSVVKKVVTKGEDNKSRVTLIYPIKSEYTNEKRVILNGFNDILTKVLIEEIREKNSQVYSITSEVDYEYANFGENFLQITFNTDYKNVEKVVENVKTTLFKTVNGEFQESAISDVVTNYTLNYETELNKNSFWNSYLIKKSFARENYDVVQPKEYKTLLIKGNILKNLQGSIKPDNYIEVVLNPEKISAEK